MYVLIIEFSQLIVGGDDIQNDLSPRFIHDF